MLAVNIQYSKPLIVIFVRLKHGKQLVCVSFAHRLISHKLITCEKQMQPHFLNQYKKAEYKHDTLFCRLLFLVWMQRFLDVFSLYFTMIHVCNKQTRYNVD